MQEAGSVFILTLLKEFPDVATELDSGAVGNVTSRFYKTCKQMYCPAAYTDNESIVWK